MQRVLIVGPSGAGKSWLAKRIAARTGLPVVHLDREFWQPGWVETAKPVWRARVKELAAGERWIMDGDYGGTLALRMERADTPITQPLVAQKPATSTKAMPVVVAAQPETLPPPKLGRRPAKPAPAIHPTANPTANPTGRTLPPTSDYPPTAPQADTPLQRPFSRTPLPQDSLPYSIESPPVAVRLPMSRPPDDRHAHDELAQRRVAQQRQEAETVPLRPRQRAILPWIAAAAFPVDGGVFDVTSTGEVIVAITPKLHVDDLAMFAVTIEKPGGVVVSKRERIVVTAAHT